MASEAFLTSYFVNKGDEIAVQNEIFTEIPFIYSRGIYSSHIGKIFNQVSAVFLLFSASFDIVWSIGQAHFGLFGWQRVMKEKNKNCISHISS